MPHAALKQKKSEKNVNSPTSHPLTATAPVESLPAVVEPISSLQQTIQNVIYYGRPIVLLVFLAALVALMTHFLLPVVVGAGAVATTRRHPNALDPTLIDQASMHATTEALQPFTHERHATDTPFLQRVHDSSAIEALIAKMDALLGIIKVTSMRELADPTAQSVVAIIDHTLGRIRTDINHVQTGRAGGDSTVAALTERMTALYLFMNSFKPFPLLQSVVMGLNKVGHFAAEIQKNNYAQLRAFIERASLGYFNSDFCYEPEEKMFIEALNDVQYNYIHELKSSEEFLSVFISTQSSDDIFRLFFNTDKTVYQTLLNGSFSRSELLAFFKSASFYERVAFQDFFVNAMETINDFQRNDKFMAFFDFFEWYYVNIVKGEKAQPGWLHKSQRTSSPRLIEWKQQFESSMLSPDEPLLDAVTEVTNKAMLLDRVIQRALRNLALSRDNFYYHGILYAPQLWRDVMQPLEGKTLTPEFVFAVVTGGVPFYLGMTESTEYIHNQLFQHLNIFEWTEFTTQGVSFTYAELFEHAAKQQGRHYFEVPVFCQFHHWTHYQHTTSHIDFDTFMSGIADVIPILKEYPNFNATNLIKEALDEVEFRLQIFARGLEGLGIVVAALSMYWVLRKLQQRCFQGAQPNTAARTQPRVEPAQVVKKKYRAKLDTQKQPVELSLRYTELSERYEQQRGQVKRLSADLDDLAEHSYPLPLSQLQQVRPVIDKQHDEDYLNDLEDILNRNDALLNEITAQVMQRRVTQLNQRLDEQKQQATRLDAQLTKLTQKATPDERSHIEGRQEALRFVLQDLPEDERASVDVLSARVESREQCLQHTNNAILELKFNRLSIRNGRQQGRASKLLNALPSLKQHVPEWEIHTYDSHISTLNKILRYQPKAEQPYNLDHLRLLVQRLEDNRLALASIAKYEEQLQGMQTLSLEEISASVDDLSTQAPSEHTETEVSSPSAKAPTKKRKPAAPTSWPSYGTDRGATGRGRGPQPLTSYKPATTSYQAENQRSLSLWKSMVTYHTPLAIAKSASSDVQMQQRMAIYGWSLEKIIALLDPNSDIKDIITYPLRQVAITMRNILAHDYADITNAEFNQLQHVFLKTPFDELADTLKNMNMYKRLFPRYPDSKGRAITGGSSSSSSQDEQMVYAAMDPATAAQVLSYYLASLMQIKKQVMARGELPPNFYAVFRGYLVAIRELWRDGHTIVDYLPGTERVFVTAYFQNFTQAANRGAHDLPMYANRFFTLVPELKTIIEHLDLALQENMRREALAEASQSSIPDVRPGDALAIDPTAADFIPPTGPVVLPSLRGSSSSAPPVSLLWQEPHGSSSSKDTQRMQPAHK